MGNKLVILSLVLVLLLGTALVCFSGRESGPAKADDALTAAPWPMAAHDPQHSSGSPFTGSGIPYLKWAYKVEGEIDTSPLIGSDGTVYLAAGNSKFYGIDADGTLKWSYDLGKMESIDYAPALGGDGTIYFGSVKSATTPSSGGTLSEVVVGGKLYAFSPEGDLRWSYQHQGTMGTDIAVGEDGTVYFSTGTPEGDSQYLCALNPDGSLKWRYPVDQWLTEFVIAHDGTVYFCLYEGQEIYALNADGTLKGSYSMGGLVSWLAVGDDDTLYFSWSGTTANSSLLDALSPDGTIKWRYDRRGSGPVALSHDGAIRTYTSIYSAGSWESSLIVLEANGSVRTICPVDPSFTAEKFTVDRNGSIYGCSDYGMLWSLDSDGELRWTYPLGGEVVHLAPAIGEDGTLYIGSQEGTLYAIGNLPESPPPHAGFGSSTDEAKVGQKIEFASSSTGAITAWLWDFGDGVTLEQPDQTQETASVSHDYLREGTYTVTLTASNPWGSDTSSKLILVTGGTGGAEGKTSTWWIWLVVGMVGALTVAVIIRQQLKARLPK
jgi:outer membrane protein assembly factor BamB